MTKQEQKRCNRSGKQRIKLHVLGAAGAVTGSLNLIEIIEPNSITRFLVDCGLTVEDPRADFSNRLPDGIKPSDINFVIISHAHIDHSGFLPKLVKDGFNGPVYLTHASAELLQFMLPDSGYLQEQAASRAKVRSRKRRSATRGGAALAQQTAGRSRQPHPLYTKQDAEQSLSRLRPLSFNQRHILTANVAVTFTDAGHILGSAVVNLELGSGAGKRTFCFSGNIGRYDTPLLSPLQAVGGADYVMVESTYGNKQHIHRDRLAALAEIINRAYRRALRNDWNHGCGVILIPSFAVGRAQVVLSDLRQLMQERRIPTIPVFVDSPMMIRATAVHRRHKELFNAETRALFDAGIDPFHTPDQTMCADWEQSVQLLERQSKPIIIIGSSGMAAGGRIVQHLQRRLPGRQNTVVFVGYQGSGTLGKALIGGLIEGNTSATPHVVKIAGKDVPVRASIEFMPDYSAHADFTDIVRWLGSFTRPPRSVLLVHGEPDALEALKTHIETAFGWRVTVATPKQQFTLT